jgi:hypothetical protein
MWNRGTVEPNFAPFFYNCILFRGCGVLFFCEFLKFAVEMIHRITGSGPILVT